MKDSEIVIEYRALCAHYGNMYAFIAARRRLEIESAKLLQQRYLEPSLFQCWIL